MWVRSIAAGLYLVLAGAVIAQVLEPEDPFRIEPDLRPSAIAYDPDRMIRMTLHDYVSGPNTTGRYTTFEFPMNALGQRWIFDNGTPGFFDTFTRWDEGLDGEKQVLPGFEERPTLPNSRVRDQHFSTNLTSLTGNRLVLFQKVLFPAKLRPESFPGYREFNAGSPAQEKHYYLGFDYCGFDVFEHTMSRAWHAETEPPDLTIQPPEYVRYPFDVARTFGYLDDNGALYKYVTECHFRSSPDGYCILGTTYNDWINTTYYFRPALLCDMPEVIDAHRDWLRAHVVEEQTEILNPRYEHLSTGSPANSAGAAQ